MMLFVMIVEFHFGDVMTVDEQSQGVALWVVSRTAVNGVWSGERTGRLWSRNRT